METRAAAERSEATRVTKPKNKIRKRCTGRIPRRCDRGYALNHLLSDVHLSKDMAEQDTDHRHTAEDKGQESQSTNMDQECKQEKTDIVKQQLSEASSSASTNRETNDSAENTAQTDVENLVYGSDHIPDSDSAGERMVPPTERSLPPEDDTALNVKDNSNPLQAEEGSRGVYERGEPAEISRKKHPGEKKAPETTSPPTLDGKNDDQVDGSDEGTPDSKATNTDAGEDDESCPEKEDEDTQVNTSSTKTAEDVQTIGPTTQEPVDVEPAIPGPIGNHGGSLGFTVLIAVGVFGIVIALLGQHLFQPKSPPQKDELRQIDIFLRQLEKVQTRFPNQRAELWSRSKIHLLRHLQTAQPTEPVSLILTAGHRGEKTLHCLAQRLASAFSSSLNASVLHIDGASKASQDSDQVKLDIDSKLRGAFEGDKPVAVINRFEELPPGSTLIFYRYCDHENAAYKKTCLIFTVLLGEEEEIPAETRLSTVEEMVDDHLQKKFLSDGHPVSFDRMDLDKYGGLWSRISHLILPVAAEERIERDGC